MIWKIEDLEIWKWEQLSVFFLFKVRQRRRLASSNFSNL